MYILKLYLLTLEGYIPAAARSSRSNLNLKCVCSLQLFALKVHLALFSTGSLRLRKKIQFN